MKHPLSPNGGKGDRYRNIDKSKYDETWVRVFAKPGTIHIINSYEVVKMEKEGKCWVCGQGTVFCSLDFQAPFCCSDVCDKQIVEDLKRLGKKDNDEKSV